jgi:pimeloyl-ACP methyl ester carboxylesterase
MAGQIEANGVSTWYDEHGEGEPLVLMHGGLVDARFFDQNTPALAEHFHVYTPERRGHGHTPDVEGPITYALMTEDTIAFLDAVIGGPSHLVGHSDGAFVAMQVAMRRPDLLDKLVLISGGFNKSGEAGEGAGEFDVDQVTQFLGPAYGEVSPDGEEHFPVVARKIADMAAKEPNLDQSELEAVKSRTLIVFSDDDLMSLEHAVAMYDTIAGSELAIVPGTSHFLVQEKPELVNTIVLDFLLNDPVPTVAAIRRAQA